MASTSSTITRPMDDQGRGTRCEFCYDEVLRGSQLHRWFDAHGDGHWLCPRCHEEAICPVVDVGGQPVVEHIDTDDAPAACGDRSEWSGCHAKVGGVSHIWRASRVAEHTINHERAHAAGMLHTPWQRDFLGRVWCTVVVAGGKYRVGDRIYVDHRGEFVLSGANNAAS